MKKLIVARGCPGSGKTFMCNKLRQEYMNKGYSCCICSTDEFFMVDGIYKFDATKLGQYHSRNLKRAIAHLQDEVNVVIIDNTNTIWKEFKKYVVAALIYEYEVEFIIPETEWSFQLEELVKRNTHGLPEESIVRMLTRFEREDSVNTKFKALKNLYENNNQ